MNTCGETFLFLPGIHDYWESSPADNEGCSTSSSYTGFLRWVPEEVKLPPLPFTKTARETAEWKQQDSWGSNIPILALQVT